MIIIIFICYISYQWIFIEIHDNEKHGEYK